MSLRRFLQSRACDRERALELDSYLELETAANRERGMTADEAETPPAAKSATLRSFARRSIP